MTWKDLMKEIYKVKGYHTESIDSLVDVGGLNLVLSKDELVELASKLKPVSEDDDIITSDYYNKQG